MMSNYLHNQYLFTETKVNMEDLFNNERVFIVTQQQPAFKYENGIKTEQIDSIKVTIMCIQDKHDYGFTKSGKKIENMEFKPFYVKVKNLNFNVPIKTKITILPEKVIRAISYQKGVSILVEDLEILSNEKK